jgi:hypothetical protein
MALVDGYTETNHRHGEERPMSTQISPDHSFYLADRLLARLAGSQARETITALPRAEARAIVQAIRTVDTQYRELRARMRDLAAPLDALVVLLPPSLVAGVEFLDRALAAGDSEVDAIEDEDLDEDLDDLDDDEDETDPA